MLEIIKKTSIDFMGLKKYAFAFSGAVVLFGLYAVFQIYTGRANLGIEVFAGDGQLLLIAPQAEVGGSHLGRQRDQHGPPAFLGCPQVCLGRLDAAAYAAENIELPGRVKPCLEQIGAHLMRC